jgi:hypothetical protein
MTHLSPDQKNVNELVVDMEKALERTTKRLKQSGLKVNQNKTVACLFYKSA